MFVHRQTISRRRFVKACSTLPVLLSAARAQEPAVSQPATQPAARAITAGPRFHFFGYYDKFQVDATGTKMLALQTEFMDRQPTAADAAGICIIDIANGNRLMRIAETTAWCWQQACMLQWLPSDPARKIIFNVNLGDRFGCRVLDIESGQQRTYDRPIYTISGDGAFALCPNFSRLADMRPGYGYAGPPDPWKELAAPEDDGIYHLDLKSGRSRLIISIAQVAASLPEEHRRMKSWFNHLLIGPDNRRFVFLHRWTNPAAPGRWLTRFFSANVDGSDLFCLNDHEMTSHFIWRDARTLLAWARRRETGDRYYFFTDRTDNVEALSPAKLTGDGHMSYRPRGDWFVTDTYPWRGAPYRRLLLYRQSDERLVEIGRFAAPVDIAAELRCDLHPRWSRDGRLITFDSVHEGPRQVYMVDVSGIVG